MTNKDLIPGKNQLDEPCHIKGDDVKISARINKSIVETCVSIYINTEIKSCFDGIDTIDAGERVKES